MDGMHFGPSVEVWDDSLEINMAKRDTACRVVRNYFFTASANKDVGSWTNPPFTSNS